jgi:hypothetical protein
MSEELKDTVKEFLRCLEMTEESDSGKVFHPVYISSCRVLVTERVNNLLKKMKELSFNF